MEKRFKMRGNFGTIPQSQARTEGYSAFPTAHRPKDFPADWLAEVAKRRRAR